MKFPSWQKLLDFTYAMNNTKGEIEKCHSQTIGQI